MFFFLTHTFDFIEKFSRRTSFTILVFTEYRTRAKLQAMTSKWVLKRSFHQVIKGGLNVKL